MFGIGGFELFIILVFGFLIFGPDKLPEIAKTVGKGIARFREAQQEMNDTLGGEKIFDPNNPDEPFKDPVEVLDKIAQRQEDKKSAQSGAKKATQPAKKASGDKASESATAQTHPRGGQAPGASDKPSSEDSAEASRASGSSDSDVVSGQSPTAETIAEPASSQSEEPKAESFTERKARYMREREERARAQAEGGES